VDQSTRREQSSSESRTRILDAAEELFAERGFAETSLADVADRCGISRGSIPWHFTNKAGLLMAVVERASTRHRHPIGPGLGGLAESADDTLAHMRAPHMALLHALLGEATRPESPLREPYIEHHRRDRSLLEDWLAQSPDVERLGMDDEALARLIYAMLIGIHVQWRVDPERVDLEANLDAALQLLQRALTGRSRRG
jgi:TetR/AcrR family acrAB operon transcriptional repressor